MRNFIIYNFNQPLGYHDILKINYFSVGLAKLLFPMEAKVVMDIAQVDGTSEFPLPDITQNVGNNTQRTTVDLNEAPFRIKEEHLIRMRALSRTGN